MATQSILLGLSASEKSQYAAEVCWWLAEKTNAAVLAQHVVDSQGAWELLGHDRPGFLGSGPFVGAYQTLAASLLSVGQKLADVYDARAAARPITSESVVDDGNPVQEIQRRANEHDLVVIGHHPSIVESPENEHRHRRRFSVAETLAHVCPSPLLVVQEQCEPWSKMRILLSVKHVNEHYINFCLDLASQLSLEPELVGLACGIHEEDHAMFVADLRKSNRNLYNVTIKVKHLTDYSLDENTCSWWTCEDDIEWDALPDTLIAMPTRKLEGRRITVYGSSPAYFIRHLRLPTILLCPEELPDRMRSPSAKAERAESTSRF